MNIIEFLLEILGIPFTNQNVVFIYYILAGCLLLVLLDGIITFFVSGITILTGRGSRH